MKRTIVFLLVMALILTSVGISFFLPRDNGLKPSDPSIPSSSAEPEITPPSRSVPDPIITPNEPKLDIPDVPSLSEKKDPVLRPEIKMTEFRPGSPVFIRIFKQESILELWVQHQGRYKLLKSYQICTWSGTLGPKLKEGDSQSPEGFYSITKKQLNPNSRYYRAFNIGFPNAYDKQLGRTGSALMVHGACASIGCYAMTDAGIGEIYPIVEAALNAGQKEINIQIFPFRMTDMNLKTATQNPWYGFWKNLKEGYDSFENTREPPQAYACQGSYVFDRARSSNTNCVRIVGW